VLRRIFGLKRDEVTEGWRKLHNEENRDLYCSPVMIRMVNSIYDIGEKVIRKETTRKSKILICR
jgi:hypothetical protein